MWTAAKKPVVQSILRIKQNALHDGLVLTGTLTDYLP